MDRRDSVWFTVLDTVKKWDISNNQHINNMIYFNSINIKDDHMRIYFRTSNPFHSKISMKFISDLTKDGALIKTKKAKNYQNNHRMNYKWKTTEDYQLVDYKYNETIEYDNFTSSIYLLWFKGKLSFTYNGHISSIDIFEDKIFDTNNITKLFHSIPEVIDTPVPSGKGKVKYLRHHLTGNFDKVIESMMRIDLPPDSLLLN